MFPDHNYLFCKNKIHEKTDEDVERNIKKERKRNRRHEKKLTRNIAVALESNDFSFSSKH